MTFDDASELAVPTSPIDEDGVLLADETAAELAALDAEGGVTADLDAPIEDGERERLTAELASSEAALDAERSATQAALARYRDALLAAEPELPPDLVHGETLEELDESVAAARGAVARIRDRLQGEPAAGAAEGGFPVGAPARAGASHLALTPQEKIASGLREQQR